MKQDGSAGICPTDSTAAGPSASSPQPPPSSAIDVFIVGSRRGASDGRDKRGVGLPRRSLPLINTIDGNEAQKVSL